MWSRWIVKPCVWRYPKAWRKERQFQACSGVDAFGDVVRTACDLELRKGKRRSPNPLRRGHGIVHARGNVLRRHFPVAWWRHRCNVRSFRPDKPEYSSDSKRHFVGITRVAIRTVSRRARRAPSIQRLLFWSDSHTVARPGIRPGKGMTFIGSVIQQSAGTAKGERNPHRASLPPQIAALRTLRLATFSGRTECPVPSSPRRERRVRLPSERFPRRAALPVGRCMSVAAWTPRNRPVARRSERRMTARGGIIRPPCPSERAGYRIPSQ